MDQRELFSDYEEAFRSAVAGILKHHWSALVSIVSEDSDGRTLMAQPALKRRDIDQFGHVTFNDHPLLAAVPVHHPGGGGVTHTFPIKAADEILSVIASRPPDTWLQQGGTSAPMSTRTHSLSDAIAIPGLRSMPRALQQISTSSAQVRDDAKLHVIDHNPQSGTTIQSADPSTAPASASFDPFTAATTFYRHVVQAAQGIIGIATDSGTTHTHGVTHAAGAFMTALNGLHSVLAHPTNGASLNANNNQTQVLAHPTQGAMLSSAGGANTVTAGLGGVNLSSSTGIALSAPSLSMPSGAAASNIGALGGDLSGSLPNPEVVGLSHVAGANTLPNATSDAAAAAAGVAVGGLYLNGSALNVRRT